MDKETQEKGKKILAHLSYKALGGLDGLTKALNELSEEDRDLIGHLEAGLYKSAMYAEKCK